MLFTYYSNNTLFVADVQRNLFLGWLKATDISNLALKAWV
jgi:hypothetical protein